MTKLQLNWGNSGKVYTDLGDVDASTMIAPAARIARLPTDGTSFDPPRMIIGDKAGAATVVDLAGNTLAGFPITGGEQNVVVQAISALSTTTMIWGLY